MKEARHGSPCVGWPHPHGVSRGGSAPGRRDECLPRAGAAETGALLESGGPFGVLTRSQIHHGGDGTSQRTETPALCASSEGSGRHEPDVSANPFDENQLPSVRTFESPPLCRSHETAGRSGQNQILQNPGNGPKVCGNTGHIS